MKYTFHHGVYHSDGQQTGTLTFHRTRNNVMTSPSSAFLQFSILRNFWKYELCSLSLRWKGIFCSDWIAPYLLIAVKISMFFVSNGMLHKIRRSHPSKDSSYRRIIIKSAMELKGPLICHHFSAFRKDLNNYADCKGNWVIFFLIMRLNP